MNTIAIDEGRQICRSSYSSKHPCMQINDVLNERSDAPTPTDIPGGRPEVFLHT